MKSTSMVKPVVLGKNVRQTFSKINEVIDMPNLIEIQKDSYKWFVTDGLKEVFRDMAAITDYSGNLQLSFVDFRFDENIFYCIRVVEASTSTGRRPLNLFIHAYSFSLAMARQLPLGGSL